MLRLPASGMVRWENSLPALPAFRDSDNAGDSEGRPWSVSEPLCPFSGTVMMWSGGTTSSGNIRSCLLQLSSVHCSSQFRTAAMLGLLKIWKPSRLMRWIPRYLSLGQSTGAWSWPLSNVFVCRYSDNFTFSVVECFALYTFRCTNTWCWAAYLNLQRRCLLWVKYLVRIPPRSTVLTGISNNFPTSSLTNFETPIVA